MSEDLAKAESRLQNVKTVTPILAALRTISLSGWQMAVNRRALLKQYRERFLDLCGPLLAQLLADQAGHSVADAAGGGASQKVLVLVIGSQRGLCGRYTKVLVEHLTAYREANPAAVLRYAALGRRTIRTLQQRGFTLGWTQTLSLTSLPPYTLADGLVTRWLERYEAGELDAVDVIYNASKGAMAYRSRTVRVLPPVLSPETEREEAALLSTPWPPILVDTDPHALALRLIRQWMVVSLYALMIEAAATERAARYQLMESATQNADRLTMELTLAVQSMRRQAITNETRELAVGAGLLDTSHEP